jgi:hypothetical protein
MSSFGQTTLNQKIYESVPYSAHSGKNLDVGDFKERDFRSKGNMSS